MISLSIPETDTQLRPRITVVGVGGAGGNAVNNMIRSNLEGVEFLVCNTDAQSLAGSLAERKIQLGSGITRGLGAGSRPDVGRAAAEEALEHLIGHLEGSHMVFITAGMGGGTGTGAAPVLARAAREAGILTVGVVTKPFHFEGAHRMRIAEAGLQELQQYVDTLIVIPNQNLFRIANEKTTFADAFKMADDVLYSGVRGVTDLMVMPGLINLDFADIRSVMSEMGKAMMGTGEAEGDRRSVVAAEAAISNPLLDDVSMKGARGVLINITGGLDMTLYEVDEAANQIRDQVDPDANIIFGSTFDETMQGRIRVSVVATGIDAETQTAARPAAAPAPVSLVGERMRPSAATIPVKPGGGPDGGSRAEPPRPMPEAEPEAAGTVQAMPAAAMAAMEPAAASAPAGAMAQAEPARGRTPTTLPPRGERRDAGHAMAPAASLRPVTQPPVRHAVDAYDDAEAAPAARMADPSRQRGGGLFRRVTGLLTGSEEAPAPAPSPVVATPPARFPSRVAEPPRPPQPAQRLAAGGEMNGRAPLPKHEDDALDIPAFLRRQAN